MAVQFTILVGNNDSLMSLGYVRIEVWQSIDNGNSYNEITSSVPLPAAVKSLPASTMFTMGGSLLKFILDGGSEVSVSFSSINRYWTSDQVRDRINEEAPGVASLNGDSVVLTSPTTGRKSSVQVTYSDSPDLGFLLGITYGLDNRIPLVPEQTSYIYSDVSGSTTSRYKWRFSNDGANPLSPFSPYVLGTTVPLVDADRTSVCSATFVGLDGQPFLANVVVVSDEDPASLSGFIVATQRPLVFKADATGYMQFTLLRGSKVRVGIEGTSFVRAFTVPDSPSFDLISVMTDAPDPFTIQTTPPFLIRRSI